MFFFAAEAAGTWHIFDFKDNLLNWLVLVGLLVWLWNKYTPPMFQQREEGIKNAISDAATARAQGEQFLQEQEKRVANFEQEKAKILTDAEALAEQLKQQLNEQTERDMKDLERKIQAQMANERQMAITELRTTAAKASLELTQQILPALMNDQVKSTLLSQFIQQLDDAQSGDKTSMGSLESIR